MIVYNLANSTMTVCEVDISFQWDSTTWKLTSGQTSIPSSGVQSWTINEAIPAINPGFYNDSVAVTAMISGDPSCQQNTFSGSVQIFADVSPAAAFAFSPARPDTNAAIQFTDQSTDSDGAVTAWHWDFGDGSNANVQSPTHRFLSAGSYHVALTVTDNDGSTGSVSHEVQVVTAPFGGGPRIAGLGIVEWGIVAAVVVAIIVAAVVLMRRRRKASPEPAPPVQPPPASPPPP